MQEKNKKSANKRTGCSKSSHRSKIEVKSTESSRRSFHGIRTFRPKYFPTCFLGRSALRFCRSTFGSHFEKHFDFTSMRTFEAPCTRESAKETSRQSATKCKKTSCAHTGSDTIQGRTLYFSLLCRKKKYKRTVRHE